MTTFHDLDLRPELLAAVTELGFVEPTPIQEQVIPLLLAGHDVLGQAQTGTGKTAAFGLPMLQQIELGSKKPKGLILAPTRELALQVAKAMEEFGTTLRAQILTVYGGVPYDKQRRQLRRGVDVVVGTPGRMLDLISSKALDLSEVEIVVLDEADEMLSMGFVEDIESILKETPEDRQTVLMSATLPREIRRLAEQYMENPEEIEIEAKQLSADTVEQRYYFCHEEDKLAVLTRIFEVEEISRAIMFARTRRDTGELASELAIRGFQAEAISGDLTQEAREAVLSRFRDNKLKVLVATDVAARGLDIDDVSHVFNFELPPDPEIYVHRIGRTGRAGKTGTAISFVTPRQTRRLKNIERYTKIQLKRSEVPTEAEIFANREEKLLHKMGVWLNRGRCRREKEMIADILEEGHDLLDVAAAALKLARSEEKARPIEKMSERSLDEGYGRGRRDRRGREVRGDRRDGGRGRERSGGRKGDRQPRVTRRSHEEGMVRLKLSAGRRDGLRPGDVVGMIAHFADIPGKSIGAIRIEDDLTYFDVPEDLSHAVLKNKHKYKFQRLTLDVERS